MVLSVFWGVFSIPKLTRNRMLVSSVSEQSLSKVARKHWKPSFLVGFKWLVVALVRDVISRSSIVRFFL